MNDKPVTPAPAVEPYRPFPTAALPQPVRSFVVEAARAIRCDPAYVALPTLVALAAAIGNHRRIRLKRTWAEPAVIWAVIVGESGTSKTPAISAALRPLERIQQETFKRHKDAGRRYETELLQYEKALGQWKKNNKPGDPPCKPEAPAAERFVVSDITVEALVPILLANPRGVMLVSDEWARWIGGWDRYASGGRGGADVSAWLSMHSGEAVTVDRKTGNPRTLHVPSACVSVIGGIQDGILPRVIGEQDRERGLLARVLLAMPPARTKQWTEADVPARVETAMENLFRKLVDLAPDTDGDDDPIPHHVMLAGDAKKAWTDFYNEHNTEQADLTGAIRSAWSKLEAYCARLALIVHMIRVAAGDRLANPEAVDEKDIAAAVELVRWFGGEAHRAYAILTEGDDARDLRRLAEWIGRRGGSVTVRDLTHNQRQFRGQEKAAHEALDGLKKAGYGRMVNLPPDPKGGRPSQRFELYPDWGVTETPADDAADGGFGYGDTIDTPPDTPDGEPEVVDAEDAGSDPFGIVPPRRYRRGPRGNRR